MYNDDDIIDLRGKRAKDEGVEFRIGRGTTVNDKEENKVVGAMGASSISVAEEENLKPNDKVKLKFDKFVNLIATHAYEDVVQKHADDDIIISTDLLADIANAHDEEESDSGHKVPLIFIIGIVLGVALTFILIKM
ncbi:MAG: hypothetical protein WC651_03375 [Candidatus Gracilibacteria bacterium]|jgi:hypothetical protein